jgi:glycosyltransferase involved in cell wall biosynthesis
MSQRPRIAYGMNTMFAARKFLPEVLDMVRRLGFEPVLLAPSGHVPGQTIPGVTHIPVPIRREVSLLADIRTLLMMTRILLSIRPAITVMSTPKMALIGGIAAWITRIPRRIYTLRGLRYQTTRSWKRALLVFCERISCACAHDVICISASVRDAAIRDGICRGRKAVLLGDRASEGIAVAPCPPSEPRSVLRNRMGIPEDAEVIGFVGRLTRDKGVEDLAQAFRILKSEGRATHLLIIGDLETGDALDRDTVEWIRSADGVHWIGYIDEPRPYFDVMDLFVFPTYREGLSTVLLEAAAAAKPVVSTRTTGVVDIVQDGITGVLVEAGDARALARATAMLLDNQELAAQMGRRARLLVEQQFDNSIYLDRLGKMLQALAGADAPRAPAASALKSRRRVGEMG